MKAALTRIAAQSTETWQSMLRERADRYRSPVEISLARANVLETFRHSPEGTYGVHCQIMLAALRERLVVLERPAP